MSSGELAAPSVKQWYAKRALESEKTADGYFSRLQTYWTFYLKPHGFIGIDEWVGQVRKEQASTDVTVRRTWAVNLESFVNSYVPKRTGRPLVKGAKNMTAMAVTSFLRHSLGDSLDQSYSITLGSKAERVAEIRRKEDVAPLTIEEVKKLYTEAKNRRDRAISSTFVSGGVGMAEWLQFVQDWHKYASDIRENKVPVRIIATRPKTEQGYVHFLWDDATEDLRELLGEREREVGRPLSASDALFVNQSNKPIKGLDVAKTIRRLADRSGVEPYDKNAVSYRVRPHELGKDMFRTQLALARVANDVAEYLTGHVVDANAYNKYHRTPEGKKLIESEASKLRPLVNIRTGKGRADTDKDTRLIAAEELLKSVFPDLWEKYEITARTLTVEEALSWIRQTIKERAMPTNPPYEYQRIPEDKADNHLNHGWEFVQVLPSGQLLIRRVKKD